MKRKLKKLERFKKEIIKGYLLIYYYFEVRFLKFFLFTLKKKRNTHKNKISLLCPSKNRSLKFQRMSKSLIEKTNDPSRIELLICFDAIEKEINLYDKHISDLINNGFIVKKFFENLNTHAKRNNFLANKSHGDIIFPINDDLIMLTSNWDNVIDKEFSKNKDNEPLCLWINCDRKYKNLDYSAFPVINRYWFNSIGYIVPEYFKFWYLDWWICEVSRLSKKYFLSKIFIHQFHAETYEAEKDQTYLTNATQHNLDYDHNMWLKTKNFRIQDSIKIKSK
jgi:hypothetical protein